MNTITLICTHCNKQYVCRYKLRYIRKYCSLECAHASRKSNNTIKCSYCGETRSILASKLNSKSGMYFCSRKCKNKAQALDTSILPSKRYESGIYSYREKATRYLEPKCIKCGYSDDNRMLDIDHIDSNRKNNHIDNLQVLCVWCHALKTRSHWKYRKW